MEPTGDKLLRCCQCGIEYNWTLGEQKFYAKKGLNPPKRCAICREERKSSGTYGTQVVSVDSTTGLVLCRVCRKPASRAASFRTNEAICSACACGNPATTTEDSDRMDYPEWEAHFNTRGH
jgi:hypothetical protein